MFESLKSWISGVSSNVWGFLLPILKSAVLKAIADSQTILIDAVTQASARNDLSGADKMKLAKDLAIEGLKKQGKELPNSSLNLGLELAVSKLKIALEEQPKTTDTSAK